MSDDAKHTAADDTSRLVLFDAREYELLSAPPVSFDCLDCRVDTVAIDEWYRVRNEVWAAANPSEHGMLCIGCLEARLGRRLSRRDFMKCYLNDDVTSPRSARLTNRLSDVRPAG
jgi:hypothetical protein